NLLFTPPPSSHQIAGQIFVFGDGDCGQLGLGEDVTEKLRPAPLSVGSNKVVQVVCGGMHTLALTQEGDVFSWGVNDEGALGRRTAGELWEKIAAKTAKDVAGDSYVPGKVAISSDSRIVQLSAGDSHSTALTAMGEVWAWGTFRDASGVYGFSPSTHIQASPTLVHLPTRARDQVVCVASGADHVAALTRGGELLTWGTGQQGQLGRVGERVTSRAAHGTLLRPHAVPIKARAGVRMGGSAAEVVDLACGSWTTFAVLKGGQVFGWGLNNYGQLGLDKEQAGGGACVFTPTAVKAFLAKDAAKSSATDAAKAAPGKAAAKSRAKDAAKDEAASSARAAASAPLALASGQHHTLVLASAERALACGRPTYGRLGVEGADPGSDEGRPVPSAVEFSAEERLAGVAAGVAVSAAWTQGGDAWLWGFGTSNQLGKGDDDEDELLPKKLARTKAFGPNWNVLHLSLGGQHVAMLCRDKEAK
ncbi:hypothetical protein H632_c2107p0, partial [Helicosporidium sp. ATCC 50920]